MKNWRKNILNIAAVIWFLVFSTKIYFDTSFFHYPRVSQESTGQVVPYVVKSRTVYITARENKIITAVNWSLAGAAMFGIVALFIYGPQNLRK